MAETLSVSLNQHRFLVTAGRHDARWKSMIEGQWLSSSEPNTFKLFDRFLQEGNWMLDVGAFIGQTALYAAAKGVHVVALEPDPLAFAELQNNIALNPELAGRVQAIHGALSGEEGTLTLGAPEEGGGAASSFLFTAGKTTWQVQGMTIGSVVQKSGLTRCQFVKMDIEGAEYWVVPAMADFLRTQRPTLFLSFHFPILMKDATGKNRGLLYRRLTRIPKLFFSMLPVVRAIAHYKYIVDEEGTPISLLSLLFKRHNTLVATDQAWVAP
ncbi:MAG: FkbM family methyltransferase [Magnetococcus sp. MYC-9]